MSSAVSGTARPPAYAAVGLFKFPRFVTLDNRKRIGRPPVSIDIELAGRLKDDGLSVREIAKRLGVSRSVVHRVLQAVPEVPHDLELVQVPISARIGACCPHRWRGRKALG